MGFQVGNEFIWLPNSNIETTWFLSTLDGVLFPRRGLLGMGLNDTDELLIKFVRIAP